VNVGRLRHPRNQHVLVSLAGPVTNVVLAGIAAGLFKVLGGVNSIGLTLGTSTLWVQILFMFGLVNLWLAMFNLLPIPPLDGSAILERFLPRAWWPRYLQLRRYTMPAVVIIVLINYQLNPGPLTWLFGRVFVWWVHVLGL
jgi:Zn-dependent protease